MELLKSRRQELKEELNQLSEQLPKLKTLEEYQQTLTRIQEIGDILDRDYKLRYVLTPDGRIITCYSSDKVIGVTIHIKGEFSYGII